MDDEVIVISGPEKGKRGRVMYIDRLRNRVIVQGINLSRRFQRPSQENPQGSSVEIERPLHLSNIAYYDVRTKGGKRLGYQINKEGMKTRIFHEKGQVRDAKVKEKDS